MWGRDRQIRSLGLLLLWALPAAAADSHMPSAQLERQIKYESADQQITALSIALVDDNSWSGAQGSAVRSRHRGIRYVQ